jgi:hypothetical protein
VDLLGASWKARVRKLEHSSFGCLEMVKNWGMRSLNLVALLIKVEKFNTLVAQLLLEKDCWKNYERACLGHLAVEAIAFDYRRSGMCELARLVGWLYDQGGMVILVPKIRMARPPLSSPENGTFLMSE